MSRLLKTLCPSLLIVLLLVIVGCGGRAGAVGTATPVTSPSAAASEQWKSQLQQAFTLENKNAAIQTKLSERLQQFFAKLQSASSIGAVKDSLALLGLANRLVGEMKDNATALMSRWDQMAALDIDQAHNTYAGQQKKIEELQLQSDSIAREWFAKEAGVIDRLVKARTNSQASSAAQDLAKVIARYSVKVSKLNARITELRQASDQYYKLNLSQ